MTLAVLAGAARADEVVYQSSPLDRGGCLGSDFGWAGGQQGCDDFVLAGQQTTLTSVVWWGSYGSEPDPAPLEVFTIRIFTGVGGAPALSHAVSESPLVFTRTTTAMTADAWLTHDGGSVYEYWAPLPDVTLAAGTTYYLNVMNNTASSWGWLEGDPGAFWWRHGEDDSWSYYSGRSAGLAFELYAVPEPATAALSALGLAALVARRRRA
jgi:hypothetical protein